MYSKETKLSLIKSVKLSVLFDENVYLKTMSYSLYDIPMTDDKKFIIFYLVFVVISLLVPSFKENVEIMLSNEHKSV